MNTKQLREIIRMFENSSLSSLEFREGEEHIKLRRETFNPCIVEAAPMKAAPVYTSPAPEAANQDKAELDFNRITEVNSPVVGVFYEASEPGSKPFVQVGDRVSKGDVLCLVEVMKQITEVTSPIDGQVADICVTNGSVVEFGQTLIKLC